MSEGSLAELQFTLEIAQELEYVPEAMFAPIWELSIEIEKMLLALRLGLDRRMDNRGA
jgi:hypothetical protein